jgi:hypothetical protein
VSENRYAPPRAPVHDAPIPLPPDAENLRREHIRHEVQLKAVGTLYYLFGVLAVIAPIMMISAVTTDASSDLRPLYGISAFYVLLGALCLALGYGFRRLMPWVRGPGAILSALGLLAIPIGTLINGWILYLMFSKKGQVVLAPTYREIVAATPHVEFQRSVGDWIALGVVLVLLLGIVALIVMTQMGR